MSTACSGSTCTSSPTGSHRMASESNGRVLVAYALLQWPWLATVSDHLNSFRRYGTRSYEYVNLAVPGLARAYAGRRYDAVVWHTSVLAWLRWSPEAQSTGLRRRALALREAAPLPRRPPAGRVPTQRPDQRVPDGGRRRSRVLGRPAVGVAEDLRRHRPRPRRPVARAHRLSRRRHRRPHRRASSPRRGERTIDIGYRTVPGKPYLGRHAALKTEIGEAVRERAARPRAARRHLRRRARGHDLRRRLVPVPRVVPLHDRHRGRRQRARPRRLGARLRRAACGRSARTRRSRSSRRPASRAATASWRCSRSRRGTSRRARPAPPRSSSRASTTAS